MKPPYHVASSALVAGILYLLFKSWSMAASCFLSGIFIDIDHIYDYVREFGIPFRFKEFIHAVYTAKLNRMTLFFHSWEVMFLILIITWLTNWNPLMVGILIGFGHHIILDKLYTGVPLRRYSFMYRRKRDFHIESLFPCRVKKLRKEN
ncbi:MAG: hypothetical protein ACW98X_20755 [Promethearchaeota archaeon]|jgi:hypothetical protein